MPQRKFSYVSVLNAIQEPVTGLLEAKGFRRKGRTYNRPAENGLVHVVNFQMGEYPLGRYVVPGLRKSDYGTFAVNLGIYLPCVARLEEGAVSGFCQDSACEIRNRLGVLTYGRDRWYSLDKPPKNTGELITKQLAEFGVPFLDLFPSYAAVLRFFRKHRRLPSSTDGRSELVAAIICHHLGKKKEAGKLLRHAAESAIEDGHSGFAEYVDEIRRRIKL